MKKLIKFSLVLMAMQPFTTFAQQQPPRVPVITMSGQVGYASPQGNAFKVGGHVLSKYGIAMDFDVLYHLGQLDRKLGIGFTFSPSFLLIEENAAIDVDPYMHLFSGVKAYYKVFNGRFSPYGSLSVGVARLTVPEAEFLTNPPRVEEKKMSGAFGLRPEIGLQIGSFTISAAYLVPMRYAVHGDVVGQNVKRTAGSLQFSIGARINLWSSEAQ